MPQKTKIKLLDTEIMPGDICNHHNTTGEKVKNNSQDPFRLYSSIICVKITLNCMNKLLPYFKRRTAISCSHSDIYDPT